MSRNRSYSYSSFNTLYYNLNRGFPLSLTPFNVTSWDNLSLLFAFSEVEIASSTLSAAILSPMKSNSDYNEQNTQALLFYCKTYNLGASGTECFSYENFHNVSHAIYGQYVCSNIVYWYFPYGLLFATWKTFIEYMFLTFG